MVLQCPKCGSARITYYGMTAPGSAFTTGQMYLCKECGYTGPLVIEKGKVSKRMAEDVKKAK